LGAGVIPRHGHAAAAGLRLREDPGIPADALAGEPAQLVRAEAEQAHQDLFGIGARRRSTNGHAVFSVRRSRRRSTSVSAF
jgi:hypothetical protein